MAKKKLIPPRKWEFVIYHINKKTKQVDFMETCRTKLMDEIQFKKVLAKQLKRVGHRNFAWGLPENYR